MVAIHRLENEKQRYLDLLKKEAMWKGQQLWWHKQEQEPTRFLTLRKNIKKSSLK